MVEVMEPRLIHTQSQKLILSPQIRQYLRLLQLSSTELETAIQEELIENPLLEEKKESPLESLDAMAEDAGDPVERKKGSEEVRPGESFERWAEMEDSYGGGYQDFSRQSREDAEEKHQYQENALTQGPVLSDFLSWQTGFLDVDDKQRRIADEIIGNIDDDGYLRASVEEIAQTCGCMPHEAEEVLVKIQNLDPPGVGARNVQEALLIQLRKKAAAAETDPAAVPGELKTLKLAQTVVSEHLPLLEKRDLQGLSKKLIKPPDEIRKAVELISRLEPKPGRIFYAEEKNAVTPDAVVSLPEEEDDDKLKIEILNEKIPQIRISSYYKKLLQDKSTDEKTRAFIREKIQNAMNFLKALNLRSSTLREITEQIAKAQKDFFEKGFAHLKPLRLKDIADVLGIHESTVSRAIQNKYISTPQGMIPYKSFFSTRLETTDGALESQKSIQEKIRGMIQREKPEDPLSDEKLAQMLKEEGIKIARRTVAKYRELMKIQPSHLRKRSA